MPASAPIEDGLASFRGFLPGFVQRLPTDLGRTFIAAEAGAASNKAKQSRPATRRQRGAACMGNARHPGRAHEQFRRQGLWLRAQDISATAACSWSTTCGAPRMQGVSWAGSRCVFLSHHALGRRWRRIGAGSGAGPGPAARPSASCESPRRRADPSAAKALLRNPAGLPLAIVLVGKVLRRRRAKRMPIPHACAAPTTNWWRRRPPTRVKLRPEDQRTLGR